MPRPNPTIEHIDFTQAEGGSDFLVANYATDAEAKLIRDRTRKLAAFARGECGPNTTLTPEEAGIWKHEK